MNKEEILNWLEKYDQEFNSNSYDISDDGVIINGDLLISYKPELKEIPFKILKVKGDLDIYETGLNSFNNLPEIIKGHCNLSNNYFDSWETFNIQKVGGFFIMIGENINMQDLSGLYNIKFESLVLSVHNSIKKTMFAENVDDILYLEYANKDADDDYIISYRNFHQLKKDIDLKPYIKLNEINDYLDSYDLEIN